MKNVTFAENMSGWSGPKPEIKKEVVEKKERVKKIIAPTKIISKCELLLSEVEGVYSETPYKELYDAMTHLREVRRCLLLISVN